MEKWSVIKHYRDIVETEQGTILKNAKIKVALIYPNTYPIASQNLGFQYVYSVINSFEEVVCERFVLDFYEDNLSIESQRFLSEFDLIFVSINYEEDVLNLIKFLESQKINSFVKKRTNSDAPIIAGGALSIINPRLLYSIVDAQLCGDFEPMIEDIKQILESFEDKELFLNKIIKLGYTVSYLKSEKAKSVVKSNENPVYSVLKSSKGEFAGEFLIELSVGCKYSCRFCTASYAYRPYRVIKKENILKAIKNNKFGKKLGLISAAFGDIKYMDEYLDFFIENNFEISVSSLRIDTLNNDLLEKLRKLNVRSITIAEETCSNKLKKLISKNITDEQVYKAVEKIAEVGVENLKLYYMIGLPNETIDDVKLIVERVDKISEIFRYTQKKYFNRLGKIKISINIFIPKPFTPMQYFDFVAKKDINEKIKYLNKNLRKIPNSKFDIMSYKEAIKQVFLSKAEDYIDDFYFLYIKNNFNLKSSLKEFKAEVYIYSNSMDKEEFIWEKLLETAFDRNILKREYKECLN